MQLNEQLRAMQRLRPGAQLLRLRSVLGQRLLEELLRLSPNDAPLDWLEHYRREDVAAITLALVLDSASLLSSIRAQLMRQDRNGTADLQLGYAALFGALLTANGPASGAERWIEQLDDAPSLRLVVDHLRTLQELAGLQSDPSPAFSLVDPSLKTLLADLLRLSRDADPVVWLREQRASVCARSALEYLVDSALPIEDLRRSVGGQAVRPPALIQASSRVGRHLSVFIEKAEFFPAGFVIHLRLRFRPPREYMRRPHPKTFVRWEGFTRAFDGDGYHYVLKPIGWEVSNQLWWWREKLTLGGWPSLDGVRQLTLLSQPAAFSIYRVSGVTDELLPVPSSGLGTLSSVVQLRN